MSTHRHVRSVVCRSSPRVEARPVQYEVGEFKEIYNRHYGAVYQTASRLVGSTLADDVAQEVFVSLWKLPQRHDPERGQMSTLLARMAHNKSVDLIRHEVARKKRETGDPSMQEVGEADDPVIQTQLVTHLGRLMAELPSAQRAAIEMAFFGDHTYKEAADLLGLPEGTVKSQIRSGLATLHRGLTGRGALSDGRKASVQAARNSMSA